MCLFLDLRPHVLLWLLFLWLHVLRVISLIWFTRHVVVVGHESQLLLFLGFSAVEYLDAERVYHVHLQEVEDGWCVDFVVYRLHNFKLEGLDLFDLQFLVSYLFEYRFHLEWVDVFELGSHEHGSDADDVKVADFHLLLSELEVAVLKRHCKEESLVITPEVGKYLNHPVNHASTKSRRDLVAT